MASTSSDYDEHVHDFKYYADEVRCCVPSCKKCRRDNPNLTYLGVPKPLKELWCKALEINYRKRAIYICDKHIDINEDCYRTQTGRIRLKRTANLILTRTCYETETVTGDPEKIMEIVPTTPTKYLPNQKVEEDLENYNKWISGAKPRLKLDATLKNIPLKAINPTSSNIENVGMSSTSNVSGTSVIQTASSMVSSTESPISGQTQQYKGNDSPIEQVHYQVDTSRNRGLFPEDCIKNKAGKWRLKKTANLILTKTYLSFMKCAKCGATNETNPELTFYKFPVPNLEGNSSSAVRCRAWAEYCWPDKVLTPEELMNVCKEKQLLCKRHFPDKETAKRYGLQLGVPADFPTEQKKHHIVRTYGKNVGEKTDSNIASNNVPKHDFLKAEKKVKKSKDNLSSEEKKLLEHNFLEGENVAELFETIDEVFEDKTDVSMYEETVVKLEPCDPLLHEGYKCDLCLSSISGYRYTCVQCQDVDLCASCEASGAHAAHYVLRIPRPRPEAEVEELLKELRYILKRRPPPEPPAEKIIPLKCVPPAEDPLLAPASPHVPSADQAESDDDATEYGSENENVLDSPQASTSRVNLNLEGSQTSRQKDEIVSPKRRKHSHPEATPTSSKNSDKLIFKCINANPSIKTPVKDAVSDKKAEKPVNLVNTLGEKLKSVLEADLTSENVQQSEAKIDTEMEINEDYIKLEIDDEDDLGKGEDIDLSDNDGLSDINEIRSRRGKLNTEHLQETLDEMPLDFIMQHAHFNDDDPLALGAPNIEIVKVEDLKCTEREESKQNTFF